ncbi:hypothetical protein [Halotalea alkalilenta]|uniref:hypothetical protein n=1 Tax=Halotalea alkalilenta TaxID=376489 RepID=UPI0004875EA2|nr:hypothetical protein [Halotalea alkalilenta]
MRKVGKIWWVAAIVVLLGACASRGSYMQPYHVNQIQPGVTTASQMVARFGEPQERSQDAQGRPVMRWVYESINPFGRLRERQVLEATLSNDQRVESYRMNEGSGRAATQVP